MVARPARPDHAIAIRLVAFMLKLNHAVAGLKEKTILKALKLCCGTKHGGARGRIKQENELFELGLVTGGCNAVLKCRSMPRPTYQATRP